MDLEERYVAVYNHRGIDICTLREAVPSNGDQLGYVVNHPHLAGRHYDHVQSAIEAIDGKLG